jgi:hypothetical protein
MAFDDLVKIGSKGRWESLAIWGILVMLALGVLLAIVFSFIGGPNRF